MTRTGGQTRLANPVTVSIPAGARSVEMWFFSSDRGGCREWDSAFGANYRFAVSP